MDTDMESAARIERSEKPAQCPQCGHGPLADIIYGFPIIDDDLIKRWNEGSIVIGGCVITGDEPRWACATCGQRIHKAGSWDWETERYPSTWLFEWVPVRFG